VASFLRDSHERTSPASHGDSAVTVTSRPVHHRWSDMASEQLNPSTVRKYITADRVTVARFELARGGIVPRHSHENEQVSCVLSGTLTFKMNGQDIVVRAG